MSRFLFRFDQKTDRGKRDSSVDEGRKRDLGLRINIHRLCVCVCVAWCIPIAVGP